MFGLPSIWKPIGIGTSIALALTAAFAWVCWSKWGAWKDTAQQLQAEARTVVISLRNASGNPKVEWSNASGQILALGDEKRQWQETSRIQSDAINDMAAKGAALRARAAELQQIADSARAKRSAALNKLNDLALTPGEREDCELLLREANDALDLVFKEGL